MKDLAPVIGDWYKRPGGKLFEVVAFDEEDATIEVQHYDGTVEEYDFDTWKDMFLTKVEPPEDWSGSFDMEREDYGVDRDDGNNQSGNALSDLLNS